MNLKRKPQTGIILCRREETEVKTPNHLLFSVMAMLLAAAWIGAVGSLCGVWRSISPWLSMTAAGLLIAGRTAAAYWKKDKLFVPVVLAVLLVLVLLFGGAVADGVCLLWNGLAEQYLAGTGRVLPELQVAEAARWNPALIVLSSLLSLLSIPCVRKARSLTAIGNAVGLFLWLLLFRITELNGWHLFLLAVSLLLLLSGGWELHRSGQIRPLLAGVMITAAVSALALVALSPAVKSWAEHARTATADTVHRMRFETEYTALPEGRLAAYENDNQAGYTALLVTMEQPEALYLRGFVGEIYENGVWKEAAVPAAEKDLLHWLQKHAFYPQTQFAAAAAVLAPETNRISVQNVNACSRFVYTPYGLTASSAYLDAEYLQPAALDAGGGRAYTYHAVSNTAGSLQELLTALQEEETEQVLSYRQTESVYRDLVYTRNLQVEEAVLEELGEALDSCCAEYGEATDLTLGQAQDSALEFLNLYFGDNANESSSLLPHLQGTHYQYATVAAMALRYYGVPARYAEGFVIPQELAEEEGQIAVDNSYGRAWVEVYQDGVGWLPLELTPGFEALAGSKTEAGVRPVGIEGTDPNAETGTEAGEGEGTFLTEGKEKNDREAEKSDSEDELPSGGTVMRIRQALQWSGILLAIAALLLILLVIARRIWLLRQKRKLFETGDLREALGQIYASSALLLSEMGLDRGRGSMDRVCEAAGARFGAEYGKACREMKQLNDLVLFSNHEPDAEARAEMLRFHQETLSYMKKHAKWYRKLWLQWGSCVY